MADKRTTVILNEADQAFLKELAARLGCSNMEAIRRAVRMTNDLKRVQDEGGDLLVRINKDIQRISFY